jgi:lysophospholipase
MGGHLLLRFLAERHPAVEAAVLVAPMIGINASPVPAWASRAVARTLSALGLRQRRAWRANERPALPGSGRQRFLTSSAERYADELWWKKQQPEFDLGTPTWGWLDAAFRSIAMLTPEALRGVETPILIIGTDRDRLVSPTAIRAAAKLLPHVELLMFPRSAHEILRESDAVRNEALSRIDAFVGRFTRS